MGTRTRAMNSNEHLMEAFLQLPNKLLLVTSAIESMNLAIVKAIKEEGKETREMMKQYFEDSKQTNTDKKEFLQMLSDNTAKTMECCTKEITAVLKEIQCTEKCEKSFADKDHQTKLDLSEESMEAKKDIEATWKSQIVKRRDMYWEYYKRKEVAEIYTNEIKKDNPRMPRKFQPKEISGEPEEEHRMRKERAIKNMETEIQLMKLREKRKAKEYKEIDETMLELIQQKFEENETICCQLSNAWKKECELEEQKSSDIFKRKKEWLIENLTDEDRGSVASKEPQGNYNEQNKQQSGKKPFFRRPYKPRWKERRTRRY